ncbi:hypothetical protein KS664_003240 [Clostridium perfringens]|nr:hypothetical protein [Clostridium perfringens]
MRVKQALMSTCIEYIQVLYIQACKRLSLNWMSTMAKKRNRNLKSQLCYGISKCFKEELDKRAFKK